jgi:ATP-dependent Clp protease ATP-binding subunit ClpC
MSRTDEEIEEVCARKETGDQRAQHFEEAAKFRDQEKQLRSSRSRSPSSGRKPARRSASRDR